MKDASLQRITVVVQASTKEEAQQVLNKLGPKCLVGAKIIVAGKLFTSEIATNDHLTDEEYKIIKSDRRVAILRDSDSKQRCLAVLDVIHDVEIGLRTLLVYMPEITGQFHALVRAKKYTKQYSAGEITKDQLNPIVGYLTLGEIIELFGMDMSIKKASDKETSWREVEKALESAKDFADFKQRMTEKLKQSFVWDVVSNEILQTPIMWRDIQNDLKKIEQIRNDAAHFHIITNAEKEKCIKLANKIIEKLDIKTKLEKASAIKLSEQLSLLSDQLAALSSVSSINGWAKAIMQYQLSSVDFSALSDSAKAVSELVQKNSDMFSVDFGLSNQIVQTAASSLNSKLEVLRMAMSSLQANLDVIRSTPNSMELFDSITSWSRSLPSSSMPDVSKSDNDREIQKK